MISGLLTLFLISGLTVKIIPERIYLEPGKEEELKLEVKEGSSVVPIQWMRWKVVPGFLGKVKEQKFLALKEGIGVIKALVKTKRGSAAGFAFVEVRKEKGALKVVVEPRRVRLLPGDSQRFSFDVLFGDVPLKVDRAEWRVIPSWLGEISEDGLLKVALRKGAGKVIALVRYQEEEAFGTASVVVGSPEEFPLEVNLRPSFAVVPVGDGIGFDVKVPGFEKDSLELEWWLDPPDIGKLEEGEFVGLKPGRGAVWVLATHGQEVGLGRSLVVVREDFPARFSVPPRSLFFFPGESQDLPLGFLKGRRIPRFVEFRVFPEGLARVSLSEEGPFLRVEAGSKPGVGFVELKGRRKAFSPRFPLLVGKTLLTIEPERVSITPGEPLRFRVSAPEGKRIPPFRWEVHPEIGGDINGDGTFIASGVTQKVYVLAVVDPRKGGGGAIAEINVVRKPELRRRIKEGMRWRP